MFGNYQIKTTLSAKTVLALHNQQYVALKRISADDYLDDDFKNICEEIKIVMSFSHQNIIKIHSVFVRDYDINVIYPFYCFGSCREAMKNFFFTGLPEIVSCLILKDLLTALEYLHNRGIIHRYIALNLLLTDKFRSCFPSKFPDQSELHMSS